MSSSADQRKAASRAAEERESLFDMIASLAALANARRERAVAVMLTAVVAAYR